MCEISANILAYNDKDGSPLLEKILDKAGQKGTGKWTGISALEMGVPLTLISEAVFARFVPHLFSWVLLDDWRIERFLKFEVVHSQ